MAQEHQELSEQQSAHRRSAARHSLAVHQKPAPVRRMQVRERYKPRMRRPPGRSREIVPPSYVLLCLLWSAGGRWRFRPCKPPEGSLRPRSLHGSTAVSRTTTMSKCFLLQRLLQLPARAPGLRGSRTARRVSRRFGIRRNDTEASMHDRARGRVLEVDLLAGLQMRLNRKCGQRGLVKAAEDQFLLAWVVVDVADREDSRDAGLELLRVHL